ncbi:MAG: NAD-dependent deacetylase, partial [Clostridium sp.]|nr:NAD-dependent deacetylase [Clostridium sp.]
MIGKETLKLLKQTLADSSYTVAVCGSGMMEEGGILGLKEEGRAYEIEQTYGESPEELFH